MDSSRILKGSLDIGCLAPADKDAGIRNFLDLIDCFRQNRVSIYKEKGFDSHEYSFGTPDVLFYMSWPDALSCKEFEGTSQAVFEMIAPSLMQHPGIGREIDSGDWIKATGYKSDFGLDIYPQAPDRYHTRRKDWHEGRADYYRDNQSIFEWPDNADEYLPNKSYSDRLLEEEIDRHRKMDDCRELLEQLAGEPLYVRFHKGVMARKGPGLPAYIKEIGSKICEANFYRYEEELSKVERERSKSPRKIYSMINREGKRQYISLDFGHGMFEYVDCHGDHVGEYRLTGDFNSEAEPDHGFGRDFRRYVK